MYSIKELENIFIENAGLYQKEKDRQIKEFKENYPDEAVPEWFTRDFCINTALAAMCTEIDRLKIEIGGLK